MTRFSTFHKTVFWTVFGLLVIFSFREILADEKKSLRFQCIRGNSPLIIHSGSTITLKAGGVYEFSSILIHKGGVLEIKGETPKWTTIRTYGNLRMEGTIRSVGFKLERRNNKDSINSKCESNFYSYRSLQPDNETVESLYFKYGSISMGGKGGAGGRPVECKPGEDSIFNIANGSPGEIGRGGEGSKGMDYLTLEDCSGLDFPKPTVTAGDGGLGGAKGSFGGLLFIEVGGDLFGEGGTIDISGGQGTPGKSGISKKYTGGGGGGGGPGGNGGKVVFNVLGVLDSPYINIDGGNGGEGGKGGIPHPQWGLPAYPGDRGETGKKGKRGEKDLGQNREIKTKFYGQFLKHSFKVFFGIEDEDCKRKPDENITTALNENF